MNIFVGQTLPPHQQYMALKYHVVSLTTNRLRLSVLELIARDRTQPLCRYGLSAKQIPACVDRRYR